MNSKDAGIYDVTKDIKQAQAAAGHTTSAMTLKYYVKGRAGIKETAAPIASAYGLICDGECDKTGMPQSLVS